MACAAHNQGTRRLLSGLPLMAMTLKMGLAKLGQNRLLLEGNQYGTESIPRIQTRTGTTLVLVNGVPHVPQLRER